MNYFTNIVEKYIDCFCLKVYINNFDLKIIVIREVGV